MSNEDRKDLDAKLFEHLISQVSTGRLAVQRCSVRGRHISITFKQPERRRRRRRQVQKVK